VAFGYASSLGFKISKYSAKTETNLTKLLTNWENVVWLSPRWTGQFSYPEIINFNDTLLIFGRDGSSSAGNWTYYRWVEKEYVYAYPDYFDNTTYTGTWQFYGSNPYIAEINRIDNGHIISPSSEQGTIGNWTFTKGYAEQIYDVWLEINCSAPSGSGLGIRTNLNDTWQVPSTSPSWLKWKVSADWNSELQIETSYTYEITIYQVRLKLNITGFSPPYAFLWTTQSMYMYSEKAGDKIFVYGRQNAYMVGTYNLYFLYSEDKGLTWKLANGTTLQMPILLNHTLIYEVGGTNGVRCYTIGAILYQNSPILAIYLFNRDYKNIKYPIQIVYYNNTLGSQGTFFAANATFENGTLITAAERDERKYFLLDSYYQRPSLWLYYNNSLLKLVALPHNITSFRIIYQDAGFPLGYLWPIRDSPEAYEIVSDNLECLLGWYDVGSGEETMANTIAYGSNFTATESGYIDAINIYVSPITAGESAYIYMQAAIYNSTFHLLASSDNIKIVTGRTYYGWSPSVTFPNPPYIEQGETYWIIFKIDESNKIKYSYETTTINQTIHFYTNWSDPWPTKLNETDLTYYTRKISIIAGQTLIIVRGLGHDVWATVPTHVGVEGTAKPNQTVIFHAYWTDNSHLDYAKFYWNASGQMQINGSIQFSGVTEAWSNFTRTLPNQYGITIAWYIVAYDIYGNYGNTTVQYLSLGEFYEVNATLQVNVGFTGSFGANFINLLDLSLQPSFAFTPTSNFNIESTFTFSPVFTLSQDWNSTVDMIFQPLISFALVPTLNTVVASVFTLPVTFSLEASHGWNVPLTLTINPSFTLDTQSAFHTALSWSFPVAFSGVDTTAAYTVPLTFNLPLNLSTIVNLGAITQYVTLQFPINIIMDAVVNSQFHNIFTLNIPVNFSTSQTWNANVPLSLNIPASFYVAAAKGAAYIVILSWNIIINFISSLTVTYGPPSIPIIPQPFPPQPQPQPETPTPTPQPTISPYALTGIILIVAVIGAASIYGSMRRKPSLSRADKLFQKHKLSLNLPKWLRRESKMITRKVESAFNLPSWPKTSNKMPKWQKKKKTKDVKMKKRNIWD